MMSIFGVCNNLGTAHEAGAKEVIISKPISKSAFNLAACKDINEKLKAQIKDLCYILIRG